LALHPHPDARDLAPTEFIDSLRALVEGETDAALHLDGSPVPSGLRRGAVLAREDARECLVTSEASSVGGLARGLRVAVTDHRARLVLRAIRDDLQAVVVASAQDALVQLDGGRVSACLVGRSDLERIGRGSEAAQTFEEMAFLPQPGRGSASLLVRDDDELTAKRLSVLDHVEARAALVAETAFTAAVDIRYAVGAYASLDGELLALRGMVGRLEDGRLWFGDAAGPPDAAVELGHGLARRLVEAATGEPLEPSVGVSTLDPAQE
jgi:hydroxymethylbilane synthase